MKYLRNFSIDENVQQAKLLLTKLNKNQEDPNFIKIRNMLNGNGYTYWFTKMFFEKGTPMEELENVWRTIKSEANIISKFETPIIKLENTEKFWDEYLLQKDILSARSMYNELPSTQKNFMDIENDDDIRLLLDLSKDTNRDLFLKKVSRYHSREKLISSLKLFLYSKSDSGFNSLLKSLVDNNVDIIYSSDEDDVIVVSVNYPQLKRFGADTSWCIVASEATFKSYNSGQLSRQFIIFLLDENNNYSKIGATSNINGISTAHLKNDQYINPIELISLLKNRNVDTSLLYPSKESVRKADWGKISVETLINIGFSKEEIIKNKPVFGNYGWPKPSKTDLEYFTKEEVEKYKLLGKTILQLSDLNKYSKEDIIKKKLISRVNGIKLSDLGDLGFTFEEIRKMSKSPKFNGDDLSEFIIGKTRSQVINTLLSTWINSRSSDDSDQIRGELIKVIGNISEDIEFEKLLGKFNDKYFDNSVISCIKYFKKFYDLSKNNLVKIIDKLSRWNNRIHSLSNMINEDLYTDYAIEILNSYMNRIDNGTYWPHDFKSMETIKNNLLQFPELYQSVYDRIKFYLIGNKYKKTFDLMIRPDGSRGSRETNIKDTIENLYFWGANDALDIEEVSNIFNGAGFGSRYSSSTESDAKLVLKYCEDNGYDLSNPGVGYTFLTKLKRYGETELDLLSFAIENLVDVETCYDKLVVYAKSKKSGISSWEKSKIESLFKKKPEYEDKWEEIVNEDAINVAIQSTKSSSEYTWAHGRNEDKVSPAIWYDKYWPLMKTANFTNIRKNIDSWEDKTFVSLIVLLAKLGKFEDMESLKYRGFLYGGGRDSGIKELTKIIADKNITNWRRTWMKLDLEQRKGIFNWLNGIVSEYIDNDPGTLESIKLQSLMAIDWYIFDKDRFDKYIEMVTKLKNNYEYEGRGEIIRRKTVRLNELEKLFNYLGEEGKFEDIENILSKFKLGKKELEDSRKVGRYNNLFYSRTNDDEANDRLYSKAGSDINKKLYNDIMGKYIWNKTNESIILKWNEFRA